MQDAVTPGFERGNNGAKAASEKDKDGLQVKQPNSEQQRLLHLLKYAPESQRVGSNKVSKATKFCLSDISIKVQP